MVQSLQTAAQLSSFWDCDITRLLKAQQRLVAMEEQLGTRVSVNAFLIKALACALKQVPIANSAIVGDDIVVYDNINVGIAIALPGETEFDSKLMVPVLKHVQHMGVVDIDKGMKALIAKARAGQLTAEDTSDSTVSFSSTAGLAPPGMKNTPVLNLPNAVLVGPSTPQEKPVVHNGKIRVRTIMPISLTFDHRIMDGSPIARMATYMHDCLENPELMLA
jgi:pyruvate/2-oxoglutarate dehydrogenase complex dihydrolipoamide acyltransferase (E2) component